MYQVLDILRTLSPTQESDKTIYTLMTLTKGWNPVVLITIIRRLLLLIKGDTTMHPSVENALEEIDAAFFSGDTFDSGKDLATVKEYVERWNRKILENEEYNKTHVPCTFTSVWDDGTEWTTDAIYDPTTGKVEADSTDSTPGDCLEREYIRLPDGTEINVCTTRPNRILKPMQKP